MRLPATRILVRATTVVVVALLVVFLPKARADFLNYEFAFVGIYLIAIVGLKIGRASCRERV